MQSLDMVLSPILQSISSKNGGRNSPKLLDKYKFIRYNDYNERNRRNLHTTMNDTLKLIEKLLNRCGDYCQFGDCTKCKVQKRIKELQEEYKNETEVCSR